MLQSFHCIIHTHVMCAGLASDSWPLVHVQVEKSLDCPVAIGKTVITLNITMADSGPAGLGITVHGRVNTANPLLSKVSGDAGIYIKSIVPGGAAALDNRLWVNDQLLSINSQSLVGKSNVDALLTLKDALAKKTANIQLVRSGSVGGWMGGPV